MVRLLSLYRETPVVSYLPSPITDSKALPPPTKLEIRLEFKVLRNNSLFNKLGLSQTFTNKSWSPALTYSSSTATDLPPK